MSTDIVQNPLFLRALSTALIIAAGLALYWLANRLILGRAREQAPGLELARPDSPVLLYFTTPTCAPCKTVQRPAIHHVKERLGDELQIIEVDASARPEIASQWGVLSVPTTFMIDASGQPRHVNHGVASAEKLLKQYASIQA
jgi:thiol-disulfide isomerase/thioredoxin